jgi:nitroimidazol reductase NimA-like FMN-containing flavoprotein (pyridoxamine 5'-phosphate oxidase superfamily)
MKGIAMAQRPDIRLTPDEQAAFLRKNRKCALATLDQEGFPHLVAMNFAVRDGAYYMTSYGKAQKVLNIRRTSKVALMVEAGSAYAELKGVMVRGHCEIAEGAEAVSQVFAWMAEDRGEPRPPGAAASAPKRVVLKIVPTKTVTWDHAKLGGRY